MKSPDYFIHGYIPSFTFYTHIVIFDTHTLALWPSYAIISDGRQSSVQRCDVRDVSFQYIMHSCFFVKCEECHNIHLFLSRSFWSKHMFFYNSEVGFGCSVLGRYNFNLLLWGPCPILRKILVQFMLVQFWGSWCKTINTEAAPPQEWQTWSI